MRVLFPDVPVMALTATATDNVKMDVITQLGLRYSFLLFFSFGLASTYMHYRDAVCFKQSFNRANLRYEVRKKDSKTIDNMVEFIKSKYPLGKT